MMTKQEKHNAPGVQWVTLNNGYRVWTQRVGSGRLRLLTLHGGPGCSHEYLECLEDFLVPQGVEVIFYDQLGSWCSDQPEDGSLWQLERFIDEIEQVRTALGLEDFYLFGHGCGGLWAIEYALKYQRYLKGLILGSITGSVHSYMAHIKHLREQLPPEVVDQIKPFEAANDLDNEEHPSLLMEHLYRKYICRLPSWPEALSRAFDHRNLSVYNTMQGNNEFVFTGNLLGWDRWNDLAGIRVATLVLAGRYDTTAPDDQKQMASILPHSRLVLCDNGSHCSMWDDPENYRQALVDFLKDVENGRI
ncbi:proline iminopeptidase-family hydrolase [Endozoicomonas sp. 8E]|uniref:proline iminopeptidase-family hydrolase n=1 Tax=Endozoicomonas sp. 8E TaxID=3035692 RepID=UPI002938DA60|nr:proline iminopeptidase-family hydrolase [Endozoicomonas sp. 8E]WOG27920.1 proline iminopeptidase-family hydrolase [Endozoicomonas sp. 8E]